MWALAWVALFRSTALLLAQESAAPPVTSDQRTNPATVNNTGALDVCAVGLGNPALTLLVAGLLPLKLLLDVGGKLR
jgi:hypothetical protein